VNGGRAVLNDLYRDLRDRRLLPIVIVLAVAIVAVPLLLGGGSEAPVTTGPVSTADSPEGGADALSPVVLADVPGLRDYRERLSRFNRRDPFKQQMTGKDTAQGGKGNLEQSGSTALDSVSSSSTSTTTGSSTTSDSSSTSTDSGSSSSGTSVPPDSSKNHGSGSGKPESKLVVTTIDVRVGKAGETKVLKGVESLEFLPGPKQPVVQFVQGDADGKHAAFVVSAAVTKSEGDGNCDPGRDDCQFLLMKKGDLQTFVYGEQQETYRLQLLAIHRELVPVKNPG
jgi:hypothetical protein